MSLYSQIFGQHPLSRILLAALELKEDDVPRFRDCYIADGNRIAIYTRTGGGNREYYENEDTCRSNYPDYFDGTDDVPSGPWNDDLRRVTGFISDEDDDFDCTYATFYFQFPEAFKVQLEALAGLETIPPNDKWVAFLDGLRARKS